MQSRRTLAIVSFLFALGVLPLTARADMPAFLIADTPVVGLPHITAPGIASGPLKTAVGTGDTPTLRVVLHSIFETSSTSVSADLSALGLSTLSLAAPNVNSDPGHYYLNYSDYYPAYSYDFGPLTIPAGVSDGRKAVPITTSDVYGNNAASTTYLTIDTTPPTIALSSITFSTTSPAAGDYMYLSGSVDGTGSSATVYEVSEFLYDADGNPLAGTYPVPGDFYGEAEGYDALPVQTALVSSGNGTFTNVPVQLIEGDPGQIERAATFRIRISAYDEAGNYASSTLSIPVPHPVPPSTTCTPSATCVSNVLFLPGIEGSRLYDSENGETRLWESDDVGAQKLAMNPDGTSLRGDVYTRDVLSAINISGFNVQIYQPFIDTINTLKSNGTINDWETIPYDWRLQLDQILANGTQTGQNISYLTATSSPYIIQELKRLASSSKTGKVTIVAHSNGGLVTKELTEVLGPTLSAQLIDKIIFVVVPQTGAVDAIEGILSGKDETVPSHLGSATERYIAQNLPTAYNLLPSSSYFTQVDDPVISFDSATMQDWIAKYGTSAIHSTDRLSAFMLDPAHTTTPTPVDADLITPVHANVALFNTATNLHNNLDTWTPQGINLFEIAGWGNETLSGITYKREEQNVCVGTTVNGDCAAVQSLPTKLTFIPNHIIDGDGTVAAPSALWSGGTTTRYWVNLEDYNKISGFSIPGSLRTKHARILTVPQLDQLLANIIKDGTSAQLPDKYITTSAPASTATNRLHFTLHSPLTLGFTDSSGNYTGSTATTTAFNIPDVQYERYGDVQWLSLPSDLAGRLVMHGTANGSFSLDIEKITNGTVTATTSFEGIPSATSTTVTMSINPDQQVVASSALQVDFNGDGTIDRTLEARQGSVVFPDITPPEAIITISTSTKDMVITGLDYSPTTVTKTATTTTIVDQSKNKTTFYFQKTFSGNLLTYVRLTGVNYGTSTTPLPSSFLYVWDASKTPISQTIVVDKTFGIQALYSKLLNKTTIIVLKRNTPIQTSVLAGLRLITLTTSKGEINYSW